ncbi:hypothetical protein [Sphingorhabdus sp. YGSMI21]|uniref:hypothetical protein n=1 Tax=Sphingorhabdus sp. YGSMI21 TaxID=2077182 RepID=UPI000C1F8688|nr:hypothetical protein [Sphingorhabdus sp. YGSMI21]ATW05138.1 hypothetical protein CHN51_17615 [Sphingorhabdus sp. YGSMI21]
MIEAKIILMIFIWPAGQGADTPRWTSDAYLTVESCEEDAVVLKTRITAKYGPATRMEHHCMHLDDRVDA